MSKESGLSIGGFFLVLAFVWVVFDNLALGLLFGLLAAGGVVSVAKKTDNQA